MCFEFGCFGGGRREDYGSDQSARKARQGRGRRGDRGNGAYYSGGTDHKTPPAATYHHQPLTTVDEEGQKAYHDGARKHHNVDAGGHGLYASYLQDRQADKETPKLPAWQNKIGDDTGYTYTAHLQETPAGRRQNAAMDYHHNPTTTANTATLVRY